MKKNLFVSACLPALLAFPMLCLAFEREHEAHEHGHAKLMIAVEDREVAIELHSPAINIVGFEHKASSQQDKEQLEKAEQQLRRAKELFIFNNEASCLPEHVKVESELLEHHDEDTHEQHHDDDKHDDHHNKHHDEHDEHEEGHNEEESHSEFEVTYHFECSSMEKLGSLKVRLFEQFPSLEEVEVQLISSNGQQLLELDSNNTVIEF